MLKAIFFDLDCTLLPMDQDKFIENYFLRLTGYLENFGYDRRAVKKHVFQGTVAMQSNDGRATNEEVFWNYFSGALGAETLQHKSIFEDFYKTEFQLVKEVCGVEPAAAAMVKLLKEKGYPLVLATNPLFPAIATQSRVRWAGLEPSDFVHITTYENSSFAKPNPAYYQEILDQLGYCPEECLMVGNDAAEDMAAEQTGMHVFLLTKLLINADNREISQYPQGDFDDLKAYIETLEQN